MTGAYEILKEISDSRMAEIQQAMNEYQLAQTQLRKQKEADIFADEFLEKTTIWVEESRRHLVELLTQHLN